MKSINFLHVSLFAAGCVSFSACMVGPDYERPADEVPAAFSQTTTETAVQVDLSRWWETFGDPQFERLVQRALTSNIDAQIARARVREARALYHGSYSNLFPIAGTTASYSRSRSSRNTSSSSNNGQNDSSTGGAETETRVRAAKRSICTRQDSTRCGSSIYSEASGEASNPLMTSTKVR